MQADKRDGSFGEQEKQFTLPKALVSIQQSLSGEEDVHLVFLLRVFFFISIGELSTRV